MNEAARGRLGRTLRYFASMFPLPVALAVFGGYFGIVFFVQALALEGPIVLNGGIVADSQNPIRAWRRRAAPPDP